MRPNGPTQQRAKAAGPWEWAPSGARLLAATTFASLLAVGCGDDPAQVPPPQQDGGVGNPDGGVNPVNDAGPPVQPNENLTISGRALRLDSYLDGQEVPVPGATINALGANGVSPVSTEVDGTYELEVPQNGVILLNASNTNYLQTYEQVTVGNQSITGRNFLMAYEQHVARMAERFAIDYIDQDFQCHAPNQDAQCRYGIVMGRVVDDGSYDNGTPTPLAGVKAEDFEITVDGYDTWYVKGPYFFFFNGQPDPNAVATKRARDMETGKYRGGLYAIFVEVPLVGPNSRDAEIAVSSYADGPDRRYFGPSTVKVFRNGFTWLTLKESGVAPPPPPPPPQDVDFETQVYPLFLPVPQGGLGCQGCHTDQGGATPAGGLNLYGGAAQAYQGLDPNAYPQRVNVNDPAQSLLLTKPLYEADGNQNHPIFAFVSNQEPAYLAVYSWIEAGAQYDGQVQIEPVSFYNDIRPLLYRPNAEGGIGCYNCHVQGVDANTAPGGAYYGGNANELYQVLTAQPATDDGNTGEPYRINKQGNVAASLLLTNPLQTAPEPHPAKLIPNANDPNYQLMYRWISEGYQNDSP